LSYVVKFANETDMSLPHWNSSLEVGVAAIDNDHKHLIELVLRLAEASRRNADAEEIWEVLQALEEYTRDHFAREEELMRKCRFEFFDLHRAEHERMRLDVKNVMEDFLARRVAAADILDFLERWLLTHIGGADTLLAEAIKKTLAESGQAALN
jgi:hemerythrin